MNKEEFIQQLNEHLMGNVSESERMDSIRYYREYIEEEMRAGKPEEEVLNSLGSAYGIAKSIIEARGYNPEERSDYEEYSDSYTGRSEGEIYREDEPGYSQRSFQVSGWKAKLTIIGIIVVIILILSLIFKVFLAVVPFLIPFLLVIFIIRLFTNR